MRFETCVMSEQQIKKLKAEEENRFRLYDYYGIDYGILDGDLGEQWQYTTQMEIDRENARLLIMQNKPIPKELEQRLLSYKKQENKEVKG